MQVKSVVANFKGKNREFKKYLKHEKAVIIISGFSECLKAAIKANH